MLRDQRPEISRSGKSAAQDPHRDARRPNIRPKPGGETIRTVLVKCGARLPIHLAHPLEDEHAVFIHALGPSLQGSR